MIVTIVTYGLRFWLLRVREFDPDEFEHLHGVWCISQGFLPYRDYFEHHTPWFHLCVAPFLHFFTVSNNANDAVSFLFFARTLMCLFAAFILLCTFWLGKVWKNTYVGLVGVVFISLTLMFLEKTLEVRPDLLSTGFWIASLVATMEAVRSGTGMSRKTSLLFALSGLLLGSSIMCSQKILMALPSFTVAMLWYWFDARSHATVGRRFTNLLWQLTGLCVPFLITSAYFLANNGLSQFIEYNFLLNFKLHIPYTPTNYLPRLVRQNPLIVAMAVMGFAQAFVLMFRRDEFRRGGYVLVLNFLGTLAMVFVIPLPNRQYFLIFLPLGAVLAASFFIDLVQRAPSLVSWCARKGPRPETCTFVSILFFLAVLIYTVSSAKPHMRYLVLWGVASATALVLFLFQLRYWASAILILALSVYPLVQMRKSAETTNKETLRQLRYVIENTSPTDVCMDGWTGLGVFRPHAFFFYFPHADLRASIPDSMKNEFVSNLRSSRITPKLVFFDDQVRLLSPEIAAFVEEHYVPVGLGLIWRRK
jgi:hypothetical protein